MSKNEFEQWVNNPYKLLKNVDPTIKRMYQDPLTEFAWMAWEKKQSEIDDLKAKLTKLESGDYVLVPKEPTKEMIKVGSEAKYHTHVHIETMYKSMIEAARGEEK